jgi:hypothetical protein
MTRLRIFLFLVFLLGNSACSLSNQPAPVPTQVLSTSTPLPSPASASTPSSTPTSAPTLTPTETPVPISLTFKPVADAYVDASKASTKFGTSNSLRVDNSPVVNSYLRFIVKDLGGRPISRARLMIYAYSASSQGITASTVADNTWDEKTITGSNAPALGTALFTSPPFVARTWVTFDITSYVTGEGTFSFGLSTPGARAISLASRESITFSPQLVLDLH